MAEPVPKLVTPDTEFDPILPPPFADSFYSSSFELVNSTSDLEVDFELTFEDLYFPSENESFFIPVDATNLEISGDCSEATIASSSTSKVVVDQKFKVEEEATTTTTTTTTTCKTNQTKRKKETEEDTSRSYKYRRLDDEKRDARLVRNRESALLSRQRKKHYVEELEDKVKNLQSLITDLNSKVSYFMSENVSLKQKVGPGKGMCWPPLVPMTYPWMPFPAYLGSHHQVVPLLPIPRLKPQRSVPKVKTSTKKVASVSVLGLLFCLFLFGALAPIVNFSYGGRVFDVSVNSSSRRAQCGRVSDQGVGSNASVPLGNGTELLVASLFVPRNEKLVKLDGNLIIHSHSASEKDIASEMENEGKGISPALRSSDSTRTRDMFKHLDTEKRKALSSSGSDDSKDKLNTTTANGEIQQWFHDGVSGPMFSSEMCTEVFQFDVSSTSGAIIPASPATQHPKNTTDTHKGDNSRRILRGGLPVSDFNLTKDQNSSNKENFSRTKPFPSMVVSVLTDPREEGSDGDMDGTSESTKSLSRVFIVVLVDAVKYVTYSCVLPRPEEVPHLVTT